MNIKDNFEVESRLDRSSLTAGLADTRRKDSYSPQKGQNNTLKVDNQIIIRPGDTVAHKNQSKASSKTEAVQLSTVKIVTFLLTWVGEALLLLLLSPSQTTFFFFGYIVVAGGVYIISNLCYYCAVTPAKMHDCYAWALLFQSKSYGQVFNIFCGFLIGLCIIPFTYFGFISFIAVMTKTKKFPERVPVDLKCRRRDCYDYYPACRQPCSCCCCFKVPETDLPNHQQGLHI